MTLLATLLALAAVAAVRVALDLGAEAAGRVGQLERAVRELLAQLGGGWPVACKGIETMPRALMAVHEEAACAEI